MARHRANFAHFVAEINLEGILKRHVTEPTILTESQLRLPNVEETTLAEAIAHKRLFILNGKGEYEEVVLATWFLENYETSDSNLLQVCSDGYEFNLDGDETRRWRR